ncbi:thiol reductant ABC exporter subunit CydC [Roseibium aggregatum]|uniref:Thiol reductant ABC exporter subunit CydC n=1 Tax=Roseibium aggregatum TaxID=187304 RepID=A0A926NRV8_9HYPH|nr:thiol reductant ABC exporter subunit CydC [Roseibium aggregatum]MBD1545329.1 thiol reductant ABC exporter subunit CydC [Roseibium aggregatum]
MSPLRRIVVWQWRHSPAAFLSGIVIALIPALAGIALLGVAGWFITAAALAGLGLFALNVFMPSALIRALAIARTAGRYGERILTHDATFRFLTNLRKRIFQGQAARIGDGTRPARSGAALNRLTSDIQALDAVYLRLIVPAVLCLVTGLLVIAWVLKLAPVAGLGIAGFVVWGAAFCGYLLKNRHVEAARRQEAAHEAMRLRSVDLVAGRRDLAVYGGLEQSAHAILKAEERLAAAGEEIEARTARFLSLHGFAGQFFLAVTLVLVSALMIRGNLAPVWGVTLILVATALPEVLGALVPGLANLQRTRLAARRAADGAHESDNAGGAEVASIDRKTVTDPVLSFRSVTFAYPGAETPVLSDFSFDIAKGETLALTGRSGCGKSTVSAIASRLLNPQGGSVTLCGQDLQTIPEEELRSTITVLGQKPYLFNDTVAANLRIAMPAATDDELWAALDMAALGARIRGSESGLETVLGEGGLGLSGGEQRRLGLARAYLTRPVLFILDEMTEGLDEKTAKDVLDRFEEFRGDASVLMIAHKRMEIDRADRVLGLRDAEKSLAAE